MTGAKVALRGSKIHVLTDSAGRFLLTAVPHGLTFITAQGAGHFPTIALLQFTPIDTVDFMLEVVGARADSVVAMQDAEKEMMRLQQRYTRATSAARSARAFTDRDIVRLAPAVTTDLLVGVVGFSVQGGGSGAQISSARDGCSPTIFVDEVERVNFSLNEIRPTTIRLLLAYNGYAVIPATLRSVRAEPTCGAISVLTK